eukprot:TRINITY_DN4794_c0_g1_i1.p1 TRINITY_DN4794_c0_g1~~TRINITY_DN4794_c0_g1_i1.p1  ORF type:complete len:614 (+),score=133.88 TRINITY_DN4794_c0_g1_i1:80-1921(+)
MFVQGSGNVREETGPRTIVRVSGEWSRENTKDKKHSPINTRRMSADWARDTEKNDDPSPTRRYSAEQPREPVVFSPREKKPSFGRAIFQKGQENTRDFYTTRLNQQFISIFPTHLVSDVIVATNVQPAIETWKTIEEKALFGLPVVDVDTAKPLAVINLFNFTTFFLSSLQHETSSTADELLQEKSTQELLNYGTQHHLPWEHEKISFRQICGILSSPGCHRVSIIRKDKLEFFITRASVIRFIDANIYHWGEYLDKFVKDTTIGNYVCFVVSVNATMFEAFEMMCSKLVGGIGVVNQMGLLVGGISIRSIFHFTTGNLKENLNLKVGDFLERKLDNCCDVDALSARETTLLSEVIGKLATCKLYRVFILDVEGKPTRIVSITDILKYISNIDFERDKKVRKELEKEEALHYRFIIKQEPSKQLDSLFVQGVTLPYPIGSKAIWKQGNSNFKVGMAVMQGWRASMEDDHVIVLDMDGHPRSAIFGIFDGHGGSHAANFLARNLVYRLSALPKLLDTEAIKKVFIDLDEEYLNSLPPDLPVEKNQGTTAVITIAKKHKSGSYDILNVNLGDSRIILAKKKSGTSKYEVYSCTEDHNGKVRSEKKRVRACGNLPL